MRLGRKLKVFFVAAADAAVLYDINEIYAECLVGVMYMIQQIIHKHIQQPSTSSCAMMFIMTQRRFIFGVTECDAWNLYQKIQVSRNILAVWIFFFWKNP